MEQHVHNFCRNVKYLRLSHKLTRQEMARIMGIGVGKLGRIEREQPPFRINAGMLCRLCDHFCLSLDAVMGLDLFQQSAASRTSDFTG